MNNHLLSLISKTFDPHWNEQSPTQMRKQKPFKMRSGVAVLQWASEEHVLGLVHWCAGELGAQIIHGWPGFFSTPPSSYPSFQGFAPGSACLFIAAPKQELRTFSSHPFKHHSAPLQAVILCACFFTQCLQPVEINSRVSDLQTIHGLFEHPPPHAMGSKILEGQNDEWCWNSRFALG